MNQRDREFYDRELRDFLPDRIFDAHTHLWHEDHLEPMAGWPRVGGMDEYIRDIQDIHPGRQIAGLFIPVPDPKRIDPIKAGEYIAGQIKGRPLCRGEYLVRPGDDPEMVRQQVRRLGLHGLKCYHVYSSQKPTWEADIPSYLPESLIRMAHEEVLVITLHMVKSRAVADESNIHWIRHYCQTYPNMKLILAHSARGFQPAHNWEGLPKLKGLENLYFDTSANCESAAHAAILKIIGHDKLMYGSDWHISHWRGRSLAASDSFLWLYESTPVWGEKHARVDPVLVGLEHLRSLKWACWSVGLKDSQVEDIFWNNAAKLLGIKE
ncbi:MAG: amidohydrolase family protein [Phycisphaerales bacterium]|jgi:glutamate-1-semialdehyde 2,1-aminomutase|nr:amidohydrolase family protein [Phycisphaerales bacterium]